MVLSRWLVALFIVMRPIAAEACSMDSEWVKPSNFELVEMSDAIVVAVPEPAGKETLRWRVIETLAGKPPQTYTSDGFLGENEQSNQSNFRSANPGAYTGGCSRYMFAKGRPVLSMLEQLKDGSWHPVRQSFSRQVEDYGGPSSPWTRLVQRYIEMVQTMTPLHRHRALREMARTGVEVGGQALTAAELVDIREHLSSLSPYKPTEILLDAYVTLEQGKAPVDGVRSRDADHEGGAAETLSNAIFGDQLTPSGPDRASMKAHVLTSLITGDHPKALPLFRRLFDTADRSHDVAILAPTLRYLARNGAYEEAFAWIEGRLFETLSLIGKPEQKRLIDAIGLVQAGDDFQHQRWRTLPRAKSVWPEFALRLWQWQVDHWGFREAHPFDDAISAIPLSDFRARPNLTLALAQQYDAAVHAWAIKIIGNKGSPSEVRLPLQIVLVGWGSENDNIVEAEFCRGGARRLQLIELTGRQGDDLYEWILTRSKASNLSLEERKTLRVAEARWKKRFGDFPESQQDGRNARFNCKATVRKRSL